MDFVRDWMHNLYVTVLAVIGVGIFMLLFMQIFYPEAVSLFFMMGQGTVQLAGALKLWPILVLVGILSALPRPRRRWQ